MKSKIKDCYGCGGCVAICPLGAMIITENKAVLDTEKCSRCKLCESVCPLGLIDIKKLVKNGR